MINPADFETEINGAARRVSRDFGTRFDWEDIAQAIALDMVEQPKVYNGLRGSLFSAILRRTGRRWCVKECAKFLKFGDQTIYSSEELKKLLPRFYQASSWPNGLSQPSWDDYDDIDEFKEVLEEWASDTTLVIDLFDVAYAFNMLPKSQRRIIEKKYRDGEKLVSKYELNLHGKAIRYLTYHVNHRIEDKGMSKPARSVVSNREAIAHTDWQEEADGGRFNADGLTKYQTTMAYNHPLTRRSRAVVNSPWRKEGV